MKRLRAVSNSTGSALTALLFTFFLLIPGAVFAADAKPRIAILATGGTIAGAQPDTSDPGYKAGSVSVDTILEAVVGHCRLRRRAGGEHRQPGHERRRVAQAGPAHQ